MILLDKKSSNLLAYLIQLEKPETIMAISKNLDQSRRKIYYHLDKINEALPADVEQIVSYPRIGIVLNAEQKAACQSLLDDLDDYSYIMSIEERMQLMLIYIGVATDRVTIEKIMQLTDVSRNTVLNDLQEIRHKLSLEQFGIRLQVDKATGYFLECPALTKIQFFYQLLQTIIYEGSDGFNEIVKIKIKEFSPDNLYFSDQARNYFVNHAKRLSSKLGKKVNSRDLQFMAKSLPYVLSAYRNMHLSEEEKEFATREFSLARERHEYKLAKELAEGVYDTFGINLDELEKSIVAMLVLSFRKDSDDHVESHDYDEMRQQIDEFLAKFETLYDKQFRNRDTLLNQLIAHCKSMLYRKTYGISSINPLTEHIKENYWELFTQTKNCVDILEKAWLITMTDDDVAYLAVHIGGELTDEIQETKPFRITLVCDEGLGVQKFLLKQCQTYLPNYDIEAVFTSEQFYSVIDILQTDVVISTGDNIDCCFPTIVVSPILTNDDIVRLIRFSKTNGRVIETPFRQELDTILKSYIRDENDRYMLQRKIEQLVNQEILFENNLRDTHK
ncbi:BglG family transcription antiterminator [Streptococcus dentiloxodontae]